jgi:Xaa-Pro aminopeptidase
VAASGSTLDSNALDVPAVQSALRADRIDGWLLYDFHGLNPIAADVTGVSRREGHMATRRWYYLIPAEGEPRGLVHAIESHTLAHLPGRTECYAGRAALEAGLQQLLTGLERVAMEYSPRCAIPYVSRVDAGTLELVRSTGVQVVSSGDLVQRFSAVWNDAQIRSHLAAAERLYQVKDKAFETIAQRMRNATPTTEYDIQQLMLQWFAERGLITDDDPNVSASEHAGDPHYQPTAAGSRPIAPGDLVLLDLWGKMADRDAVYADITWVGYVGSDIPERYSRAFDAIVRGRDAAIAFVQSAARDGRPLYGWEVDRSASSVVREAGYGDAILHRTGHSLGTSVHGTGVNMDDYETHDDRRLLPGTGFTIEPGVYFPDFGVRTEINMIMRDHEAVVTGACQTRILALV